MVNFDINGKMVSWSKFEIKIIKPKHPYSENITPHTVQRHTQFFPDNKDLNGKIVNKLIFNSFCLKLLKMSLSCHVPFLTRT